MVRTNIIDAPRNRRRFDEKWSIILQKIFLTSNPVDNKSSPQHKSLHVGVLILDRELVWIIQFLDFYHFINSNLLPHCTPTSRLDRVDNCERIIEINYFKIIDINAATIDVQYSFAAEFLRISQQHFFFSIPRDRHWV